MIFRARGTLFDRCWKNAKRPLGGVRQEGGKQRRLLAPGRVDRTVRGRVAWRGAGDRTER